MTENILQTSNYHLFRQSPDFINSIEHHKKIVSMKYTELVDSKDQTNIEKKLNTLFESSPFKDLPEIRSKLAQEIQLNLQETYPSINETILKFFEKIIARIKEGVTKVTERLNFVEQESYNI
jgi:hypothetical protein